MVSPTWWTWVWASSRNWWWAVMERETWRAAAHGVAESDTTEWLIRTELKGKPKEIEQIAQTHILSHPVGNRPSRFSESKPFENWREKRKEGKKKGRKERKKKGRQKSSKMSSFILQPTLPWKPAQHCRLPSFLIGLVEVVIAGFQASRQNWIRKMLPSLVLSSFPQPFLPLPGIHLYVKGEEIFTFKYLSSQRAKILPNTNVQNRGTVK